MEPYSRWPNDSLGRGAHMTLVWLGATNFDPELGEQLANKVHTLINPGFVARCSGYEWFEMPSPGDPLRKVRVALIDVPHMLHVARHSVLSPFNRAIYGNNWRPHISLHQGIRCPQLGEELIFGRAEFKQ